VKSNLQINPIQTSPTIDVDGLLRQGWLRVPDFFEPGFLELARTQCSLLEQLHYHGKNLETHSVYLSDHSPSRRSHAMMVTTGHSPLPYVGISSFEALATLLELQNSMLASVYGVDFHDSRSMLNWQSYESGSSPVPEHFDGEYLRFKKIPDRSELRIEEAIVPKFIFLFVESNENLGTPAGVQLKNMSTGELVCPPSVAGDLLIFNNLRFFHSVPRLPKSRRIIGLRNFDLMANHFVDQRKDGLPGLNYSPMAGGWVAPGIDSVARQKTFLTRRWPAVWAQTLRDGAVF
jgi:hypothetical protein